MESTCRDSNTTPIVTTDFLYLRFIGDRSIREKDFGRIQIDRVIEMQKWANDIQTVEDEGINLAIVAANNHYAGFGPGTVNIFRKMLELPEAKREEKEEVQQQEHPPHDLKQRTLSDFLS
jgi:uncharacterized protein YecE (DUF72 family)